MHVINATNVNDALAKGIRYLAKEGIPEDSRNGAVLVAPGAVATVYSKPWQRVLFSPMRDANPFFHLMESLWMLAGRNDVEFVAKFAGNMRNYSDDGKTLWGAYGWRWRQFFGFDQLNWAIRELTNNPSSRRVVVAMWNAMPTNHDNGYDIDKEPDAVVAQIGKDVPCNTHIYFDVRGDKLNMTVCNRSNDIWWGAYGANAVHMSVLQEYIANRLGVEMGTYTQISNNYHLYTNVVPYLHPLDVDKVDKLLFDIGQHNLYANDNAFTTSLHYGLGAGSSAWDDGLRSFFYSQDLNEIPHPGEHTFFTEVARPMRRAWQYRKEGNVHECYRQIQMIQAEDWRAACQAWVYRREVAKQEAALV